MEKKCENCKHCYIIDRIEHYDDVCIECIRNEVNLFEPKLITNEEWFCKLPAKEKAKLMSAFKPCTSCLISNFCKSYHTCYTDCEESIMRWLQAEHKE